jgi:tRNA threonylcarbamoyl adenosine modification protein YeaZ
MSAKKKETIVLSVETATRSGSLAVLRGQEICAKWCGNEETSHSSELLIETNKILLQSGIELDQVDLFAGARGPGSFTGLRIGLATLKGFRTAHQKTICGVPTLEAMAFQQAAENANIVVLPAGRQEVFVQNWKLNEKKELLAENACCSVNLVELLSSSNRNDFLNWIVAPESYDAIASFIKREEISNWSITSAPENLAVNVGRVAYNRFINQQIKSAEHETSIIYGRGADVNKKTF